LTNEELNGFLKTFYEIKEQSISKTYGFDDEWNIFIKKVLPLSPKSFGTKIQNRVIFKNALQQVKANEDKGDFEKNNQYFEIKTSLLTVTNKTANITGVRPWQKIEGYYIFIVNAKDLENISTYSFRLTKDEMEKEIETLKAIPINGTKKANKGNQNLPLRFGLSVNVTSEHFKRWEECYAINSKEFNRDNIIQQL
jgi:hypothetical protein